MPYVYYGCPACEEPDDLQQYNEGDKCEDCGREVIFYCPDWLRPGTDAYNRNIEQCDEIKRKEKENEKRRRKSSQSDQGDPCH